MPDTLAPVDGHGTLGGLERTVQCSISAWRVRVLFGALSLGPIVRLSQKMSVASTSGIACGTRWCPSLMCLSTMWTALYCPLLSCWSLGSPCIFSIAHSGSNGSVLACLLEWLLLGPMPWPSPLAPAVVHPVSTYIAEGESGAVIDIPYTVPQTTQAIGDIFFQQTVHKQPIPYRLEGVGPNMVHPTVRDNPFFERIHNLSQQEGTSQDAMCRHSGTCRFGLSLYCACVKTASTTASSLEYTLSRCLTLVMTEAIDNSINSLCRSCSWRRLGPQ